MVKILFPGINISGSLILFFALFIYMDSNMVMKRLQIKYENQYFERLISSNLNLNEIEIRGTDGNLENEIN